MNFKENETDEKLRGCYYTPPDIADFLTKWVWQIKPQSILEPSCGYGVFIESVAKLLGNASHLQNFLAFEIDKNDVKEANARGELLKNVNANIEKKDFLNWSVSTLTDHLLSKKISFDAIIGNPPFIRYQFLENESQHYARRIFEEFNLKFTMHTNAWVPFVIASIALLRPGGRLAMVVPAEILHVLHAYSLRIFLTSQCSKILIFDPEELWFENVLQGAVLLLAEKKFSADTKSNGVAIIQTKSRKFLKQCPEDFFTKANYVNGEILSGIKWMRALLTNSERTLLDSVISIDGVFKFGEIAEVDVGIVTGCNNFFLVTDDVVSNYGLEKWAHPMFGRSDHVDGVIYDTRNHLKNKNAGLPTNFLWFTQQDILLKGRARDYIKKGEADSLHKRYKCRIRNPWYAVPSVYLSPIGMLKRSHDFPRLILNTAKAFTTDTAYRIKTKANTKPKALVFSFINSLTALSAELEGRHYGGGVLELVPSEIERVYIPLIEAHASQLRELDGFFKREMHPFEILKKQDKIILRRLGLSDENCLDLFSTWLRLRNRRQRTNSNNLN